MAVVAQQQLHVEFVDDMKLLPGQEVCTGQLGPLAVPTCQQY